MFDDPGEFVVDSRYLQTCDIPASQPRIEPFTLVIMGGGGDLSRRKLVPSLFHLFRQHELPEAFSVIAFDRLELDDDGYRAVMKEAVKKIDQAAVFDESAWDAFDCRLFYVGGVFEDDASFVRLTGADRADRAARLGVCEERHLLHGDAATGGPPGGGKNEGPWSLQGDLPGEDRRRKALRGRPGFRGPAQQGNHNAFDENQVYRIDHYLAKEPVDNIIFFRFSNTIFEEVWNRRYVDNVQITVAEDIGIQHRGAFYEKAGVVRDIVQNHLLQILSLMSMEAPIGFVPEFIRDEKAKIVRSIRPVNGEYVDRYMVRGQYGQGVVGDKEVAGYREEPNVSASSTTPTFFAGKFLIDNLRWAGVPFYLRTGKRLPRRVTEICIQFKRLPLRLFGRTCDVLEPNVLFLTIQPDEKIALRFLVKYPFAANQLYTVRMDFSYKEAFKTPTARRL